MEPNHKIVLPADDDALIRQCEMSACRSSGPGGQHVNTTDSAVRLKHHPSGLVVTSQQHRSQTRNRQECIRKLRKLVARLNYRKPRRVATRISNGARQRRRAARTQDSEKKQRRQRPSQDD